MQTVLDAITEYQTLYRATFNDVTIIEDSENKVLYSGAVDDFLRPIFIMQNFAYEIKMREVNRKLELTERRLFLFV